MIDDFNGGRRPVRRGATARRPLQFSRRFSAAAEHATPAPVASRAADSEAQAIALAWDDGNFLDATLPDPLKNPLFSRQADDEEQGDAPEDGKKDEKDSKKKKGSDKPPGDHWYQRLWATLGNLSRTQWLVVTSVFLIVSAACSSAWLLTQPATAADQTVATSKPKPKPLPPPTSPLTGLEVPVEDTKRIVTAVMIENSTTARPQSGLQEAGVVYEAIAEYGITRFLALYQEAKPGNIGPVRSVRPYYVDWSKSYDAPIAHVGGSPEALAKIKSEGVKDLDQFFNSQAYRRDGRRFAPHNVYTTMAQLNEVAAGKGWKSSSFTGFARKKEAPVAAEKRTANRVDIAISTQTYNTHYDYDPAVNAYKRVMAGAPHVDADNGKQITAKVVVAIATDYGLQADGYHSKYRVTGSGSGFVFQDGIATPITWNRPEPNSQYSFTGPDGKPLKLNPGQTWITMVGAPGAVTFAQ